MSEAPFLTADMRDREIRESLRRTELAAFIDDPHTQVVEELGIMRGDFRIDVAVVNGVLHGWEIKSDYDTLARLPAQAAAYNQVFDELTIVVGSCHVAHAKKIVPRWWGIVEVQDGGLTRVRDGTKNNKTRPEAVVQLLWREEAAAILDRHGLIKGLRTKPRGTLWAALVRSLAPDALALEVREAIKARGDWRVAVGQA